jgi:hypothetical protein
MRQTVAFRMLTALAVLLCFAAAGCAASPQPPQVMVTALGNYPRAALGPNCNMPILTSTPSRTYHQVAIVEGWGAVDQSSDVDAAAKRQACETGADALLVVSAATQNVHKNIYDVGPNESTEQEAGGSASNQHGLHLHQQEYNPTPGEEGHNGYYLDTVAIVYDDSTAAESARN